MVQVTVNGVDREIGKSKSVLEFLEENSISAQFIAVAHNGVVLHKEEYSKIAINEGDSLEIVRMVGGG